MKNETVDGAMLETWTVEEVVAAYDRQEIVLIDVRTIHEYGFEHIGGALLLPLPFFEASALPGQSDKRIVFMCGSGVRSEKVARACIKAGFERIAHMEGGFAAWKAARLPYVGTNMATGAPQPVNM
ncbi:rhodanese-like domain-containing protein [Roseovarius amoyensis]|uniref:rhodanese-like domain-containing protein n=1 Tax=Roseovarius amoyensis TaxID=2211448 RepID=UPI000DBE2C0E|nr:rhodanese-like domain-containing protein [Roseovarius amoyensis]